MDERDMSELLGYYAKGTVPTFEKVRLKKENVAPFDGSMGWSC